MCNGASWSFVVQTMIDDDDDDDDYLLFPQK